LHPNDNLTVVGGLIRNNGGYFRVDQISSLKEATVTPLSGVALADGSYIPSRSTGGRLAPYMELGTVTWGASALTRSPVRFPQSDPNVQSAKAFAVDPQNHPTRIVLGAEFRNTSGLPFQYSAPQILYEVDAAFGDWQRDTGDTSNNPELSWEYWNGKGWSSLDVVDATINLQTTGP
jgi:hypothetical protein